jgi:uncharacterized protein
MRTCPICNAPRGVYPDNEYAPFCSERCKLIDLGNWLSESYRVPDESSSQLGDRDSDDDLA